MDSRASSSTSALTSSSKPKPLVLNTSNHASMVTDTLTLSPSSFRSSPLNPKTLPSPEEGTRPQKRSSFPASRPLRPFPSIAHSLANTKLISPSQTRDDSTISTRPGQAGPSPTKKPQKSLEISSKWKGGFFVLGMTQAEFSRRD